MYVYTHVCIYIERARQTDRQTDRETERQTDRQTDRETDRDRDRVDVLKKHVYFSAGVRSARGSRTLSQASLITCTGVPRS